MSVQTALDRLLSDSNKHQEYSMEEMLDDENNQDVFLDGMSEESKNALYGRVTPKKQEDDLDKTQEIPVQVDTSDYEQVEPEQEEEVEEETKEEKSHEVKRGRGRPRKETAEKVSSHEEVDSEDKYNPIINALSISVIDNLIKENYTIMGFSNEHMKLIFEYMKEKLGE